MNPSDSVRWGVIGLGWFGEIHADTLAGMPGIELAALCTRRHERLRDLADRYGVAARYTNYRQLLDDPTVDAVSVTSPAVASVSPLRLIAVAATVISPALLVRLPL